MRQLETVLLRYGEGSSSQPRRHVDGAHTGQRVGDYVVLSGNVLERDLKLQDKIELSLLPRRRLVFTAAEMARSSQS